MLKKYSTLIFLPIVLATLIIYSNPITARDFVHIFTNKGVYETCEDLWFKAIVLNDSSLNLSDKSHTAFVELLNPQDSVVWNEKYPVINGQCDGQIYVGEEWETGIYRMYVNTHSTVGLRDTVLTPKKILIVRELPEAESFVTDTSGILEKVVDSINYGKITPLTISIELDSAEYHTRSKVHATIRVTDTEGNPTNATIALSVFDYLYNYRPGELDLISHAVGIQNLHERDLIDNNDVILTDVPISGYIKAKKIKQAESLDNQFINVFDYTNTLGNLNFISTKQNGRFEVPMDIAASLGWEVLLKPISEKKMNNEIEFAEPFDALSKVHKNSKDIYFPILHKKDSDITEHDTLDYLGRRTILLNEITVNGHAGRYPKRNKLLGYLDSISTHTGGAWICGCPAGGNTTFLNDYIPGYTHHPNGYGRPYKIGVPEKGKDYELIKYSGGTNDDWVEDIRHIVYPGPKYTEEELLRMNGMWKTKGYYPHHDFKTVYEDEIKDISFEDNRNTLLWLPNSVTNDNGELNIDFYTSDMKSIFYLKGYAITPSSSGIGTFNCSFRVR